MSFLVDMVSSGAGDTGNEFVNARINLFKITTVRFCPPEFDMIDELSSCDVPARWLAVRSGSRSIGPNAAQISKRQRCDLQTHLPHLRSSTALVVHDVSIPIKAT